ncbi:MAG: PilZ domain protein [Firmicutes bacterium ADurb.Bin419]|nr:MAG: PilZ domain protein [Firmicutes bacterium ADurb.Bin419]
MESARLREFLGEGTIIRTKHCSSSTWVTNVIYAINEDYIEIDIGLEKDYIDNMIMIGDTMKCKYASDEYEVTLIGWVTRIKADFPQSITIKVHDIEKFANKRNSYRFDVYLCSVIKVKRFEEKGIFAILTNLSRTGAAFVIKEEIEKELGIEDTTKKETVCVFEVYVSPEKQILFEGTIQRKCDNDRGKEYGVKITDIDLKSEKVLLELLEELEKKDKEFYNKRSSFWSKHSKYINGEEK